MENEKPQKKRPGRKPGVLLIENAEKHKAAIIEWISSGKSLRSYCAAHPDGPSVPSVINWTTLDPVFAEQYEEAQARRADVIFDELDDVVEKATHASSAVEVAGLRLKVDTLKWKLAKMVPKKYGDRQQVEHSGGIEVRLYDPDQAARMAKLAYASEPGKD